VGELAREEAREETREDAAEEEAVDLRECDLLKYPPDRVDGDCCGGDIAPGVGGREGERIEDEIEPPARRFGISILT